MPPSIATPMPQDYFLRNHILLNTLDPMTRTRRAHPLPFAVQIARSTFSPAMQKARPPRLNRIAESGQVVLARLPLGDETREPYWPKRTVRTMR